MKVWVVLFVLLGIGPDSPSQNDETKCCCTTYDTSVCLTKVHDKIDAKLNATYQKTLGMTKRFGEEAVENLKDAQQKWITYRDAACKAEYGLWGGGTGGPNAHAMCEIRLTRQRTEDLESVYTNMNR
jgi:uncharacterized protein YecT (DUF1311 family)